MSQPTAPDFTSSKPNSRGVQRVFGFLRSRKTNQNKRKNMKFNKLTLAVMTIAGSIWGWNSSAQFATGDLMLGFRAVSGSSSNVVVDIGPASTFLYATGPTNVTAFSAQQITDTFGSLNNLYLSVFGYVDVSGNPYSFGLPANTLLVSGSSPVHTLNDSGLGIAESYLSAIANGANATSLGAVSLTASVVREPSSMNVAGDLSYFKGVANPNQISIGNIHNTWAQSIEQATSATFGSDTTPLVIGFYEYQPGSSGNPLNNSQGLLVGEFQFNNDGSMTYTSVPEPTTWAMIGSGILMLVTFRRFGRKNQI
jgi:hypothetical protein